MFEESKVMAYTDVTMPKNKNYPIRIQVSMSEKMRNEILKYKKNEASIAEFIRVSIEKQTAKKRKQEEAIYSFIHNKLAGPAPSKKELTEWQREVRKDRS